MAQKPVEQTKPSYATAALGQASPLQSSSYWEQIYAEKPEFSSPFGLSNCLYDGITTLRVFVSGDKTPGNQAKVLSSLWNTHACVASALALDSIIHFFYCGPKTHFYDFIIPDTSAVVLDEHFKKAFKPGNSARTWILPGSPQDDFSSLSLSWQRPPGAPPQPVSFSAPSGLIKYSMMYTFDRRRTPSMISADILSAFEANHLQVRAISLLYYTMEFPSGTTPGSCAGWKATHSGRVRVIATPKKDDISCPLPDDFPVPSLASVVPHGTHAYIFKDGAMLPPPSRARKPRTQPKNARKKAPVVQSTLPIRPMTDPKTHESTAACDATAPASAPPDPPSGPLPPSGRHSPAPHLDAERVAPQESLTSDALLVPPQPATAVEASSTQCSKVRSEAAGCEPRRVHSRSRSRSRSLGRIISTPLYEAMRIVPIIAHRSREAKLLRAKAARSCSPPKTSEPAITVPTVLRHDAFPFTPTGTEAAASPSAPLGTISSPLPPFPPLERNLLSTFTKHQPSMTERMSNVVHPPAEELTAPFEQASRGRNRGRLNLTVGSVAVVRSSRKKGTAAASRHN